MRSLILALICLLTTGLCYGKEITINRLLQIKDQHHDLELIDFFSNERDKSSNFWVVAREADIGNMYDRNKIKILEIVDSKVTKNIALFDGKDLSNILDIYKTTNNITIAVVENYKSISIYDFTKSSSKVLTFSQKLSIKNGYIQSAVINNKEINQIYISYVDSGHIKTILMDYASGKVVWTIEIISNDGVVGSIVDMVKVGDSLLLAGVISINAKTKGWLGRIERNGAVAWQRVMDEERVKFSESLFDNQVDVLQEDAKDGRLFVEPLNNLINPKTNKVPFLVSDYGAYIPWVGRLCKSNYLLVSKKVKGKDISLSAVIGKYTGKQQVEKLEESSLFKADNGTYINYISRANSKLYLGDSFVYVDADRILRSGIEFSELVNTSNCALE